MRPSTLGLAAAILLGWVSGAPAGPAIASLSQAVLEGHRDIELVRRHHRGRGWGHWGRGRFDRDFTNDNPFAETVGRRAPEAARPDRRRRGGWVDPPQGLEDSR